VRGANATNTAPDSLWEYERSERMTLRHNFLLCRETCCSNIRPVFRASSRAIVLLGLRWAVETFLRGGNKRFSSSEAGGDSLLLNNSRLLTRSKPAMSGGLHAKFR
jgi:hypothetical protein